MIFEKLKSGRYESIIVYNPKIFDIEALKYCYIALYYVSLELSFCYILFKFPDRLNLMHRNGLRLVQNLLPNSYH